MPDYIDVKECVECEKDHENLETNILLEEDIIVVGEEVYTHYVVCPVTNRRILVCQRESD